MSLIRKVVALAMIPFIARGQESHWRSVDIARQARDTGAQRIRVQYRTGKVDVRGTSDPLLYSMHLRYDDSRAKPLHRHDAERRVTSLGIESRDNGHRGPSGESGELRIALSRTVPLELDMELGATESSFDLGGMSLQALRLECGGTEATLMFSQPNRTRMREVDIDVGAADFTAVRLGNSNAEQLRFRGGVGDVDLDFGGAWSHDMTMTSRLILGKLTLRVPPNVGLRVELQRFATTFDAAGLEKRDDAWYSPNFDTAPYKLRVRAETVFGQIEIQRMAR